MENSHFQKKNDLHINYIMDKNLENNGNLDFQKINDLHIEIMKKSKKSIIVDVEKLNHHLKKPEIKEFNKFLEYAEIYNMRTENGLNKGIKIKVLVDIPEDLKIPEPAPVSKEPVKKVRKVRCDKSTYICECCDKSFKDNWFLEKHEKTKIHKKKFNEKNKRYDPFTELLGELN